MSAAPHAMRAARGLRGAIGAGALAACMLAVSACGSLGVAPWQRGTLAKPVMLPESDQTIDALDDHIYFSKESTSGGRGFGGGGCGCN